MINYYVIQIRSITPILWDQPKWGWKIYVCWASGTNFNKFLKHFSIAPLVESQARAIISSTSPSLLSHRNPTQATSPAWLDKVSQCWKPTTSNISNLTSTRTWGWKMEISKPSRSSFLKEFSSFDLKHKVIFFLWINCFCDERRKMLQTRSRQEGFNSHS